MNDKDRDDIAKFTRIVRAAFEYLILALKILERMQTEEQLRNAFLAMHGENAAVFQDIAANDAIQAALATIQQHPEWLAAVGYSLPQEQEA
jgi:hypothetical protein